MSYPHNTVFIMGLAMAESFSKMFLLFSVSLASLSDE